MADSIKTENLNLWYGENQALKKYKCRNIRKADYSTYRTFRLRQINLSENAQPYE